LKASERKKLVVLVLDGEGISVLDSHSHVHPPSIVLLSHMCTFTTPVVLGRVWMLTTHNELDDVHFRR
jgi:hypothetical protein